MPLFKGAELRIDKKGIEVNLKSPGPDGLYTRVLKELINVIIKSPTIIFENSQRTNKTPGDPKTINAIPIMKKEKRRRRTR